MSLTPTLDDENETSRPVTAAELSETLRTLSAQIPHFSQLTNLQVSAMRRAASLDPEWLHAAIAAVGNSPVIQAAIGATSEELLRELDEANRWTEVESAARALLRGIAAANLIRRHRLGIRLLQAYGISRQLVRQPEHHHLRVNVAKMKEMNRRARRKEKGREA
jgi:hypothetical protein